MLDLCCDETYIAMTNHVDRYDYGDNDRNEDVNDNDNASSRSGSDGPIFNPISAPWSCLGLAEKDEATMTMVLWLRHHMYIRIVIYLPYI